MPMSWDAAADAKLFTVVMAVYDIKLSGPQNEKIAKLMGEDVTPKAITHRLSKIKAQANTFTHSAPRTPASRKPSTPASKTSKTPSSKGKGLLNSLGKPLSATHTITTLMHDNGEDDEEDFETPTKTEPGAKKRKIAKPKIEDTVDLEGEDEGMGDAIDFSLGYTGDVKMEEGEVLDLTDEVEKKGKGKEKEEGVAKDKGKTKVKQEVVDVEGVYEDEDGEMVV